MSMMEKRMRLPSYGMRDKLLADIRGSRVIVVSGETGCGKTTQVPQCVIDDMDARGEGAYCSIICTQPRRISAMSVAERVSSERCERQCLPSVLTIAAGMAYKDPWVMPLDKKQAADEARRRFAGESCSDHIALLTAYNEWKRMPAHVARDWCWRNYLSGNTLDMMRDMRRQFLQLLETIGFVDRASSHALGGEPHGKHSEQLMLVRAVLTAGMYPNLVSVEAGKREAKWHTFDDGKVKPRPSSVNSFVRGKSRKICPSRRPPSVHRGRCPASEHAASLWPTRSEIWRC